MTLDQGDSAICPRCGSPAYLGTHGEGYCDPWLQPPPANPEPKVRKRCCGIIWEHGAFSQAQPCADCPERTA